LDVLKLDHSISKGIKQNKTCRLSMHAVDSKAFKGTPKHMGLKYSEISTWKK
jgi:hypothetical protein